MSHIITTVLFSFVSSSLGRKTCYRKLETMGLPLLLLCLQACNGFIFYHHALDTRRRIQHAVPMESFPPRRPENTQCKAFSTSCEISGVSISPKGFHVMLRDLTQPSYVGIQVTQQDTQAATTPHALTLLQLLASVDMAGAVLPPELLSQLVVVLSDEDSSLVQSVESSIAKLLSSLGTSNGDSLAYLDQSPWLQSKVRLPTTTLEDVTVVSDSRFLLSCAVEGHGRYSIALNDDDGHECFWKELLYEPSTVSAAFVALALALRYNTPISVSTEDDHALTFIDEATLRSQFPNYQSADEVLEPADRSADHIARGFEINTLQAALRMAMDRNDALAATKIRAELDRLDSESMKDLPVQPETDINSMQ